MSKNAILVGVLLATLSLGTWGLVRSADSSGVGGPIMKAGGGENLSCPMQSKCGADCPQKIAAALKSLDAVEKAVKANDSPTALKELAQVRQTLAAMHQSMLAQSIANDRCPIMNSAINPAQTTAALTRVFQGKTVAFCCAGCPAAWDKLTDAQKAEKLAKVTPAKAAPAKPSTLKTNPAQEKPLLPSPHHH